MIISKIKIFSYLEYGSAKDTVELVDVEEVLGHVSGQDHVDHALSDLER